MTGFDIVILLLVGAGAVAGFFRGFVEEVLSLVAWVFAVVAIRYMQRTQHIHRIMANYMPHNQRSGNLLARLGFEKEGYAKDYLLIDGEWRDHVLTALTTRDWTAGR